MRCQKFRAIASFFFCCSLQILMATNQRDITFTVNYSIDRKIQLSLPSNTLVSEALSIIKDRCGLLGHITLSNDMVQLSSSSCGRDQPVPIRVGRFNEPNSYVAPYVINPQTSIIHFYNTLLDTLVSEKERNQTSTVTCSNNRIQFNSSGFGIDFHRTLRIPDTGKSYPLPPTLGRFPMVPVAVYKDKVPPQWAKTGGIILPMHQSEAMWMCFSGFKPCAIRVASGKINAVSGQEWGPPSLLSAPQNYVVRPAQPWLDGFNTGNETVRQFVSVPLGSRLTVEHHVKKSLKKKKNKSIFKKFSSLFRNTDGPSTTDEPVNTDTPEADSDPIEVGGIQFEVYPRYDLDFKIGTSNRWLKGGCDDSDMESFSRPICNVPGFDTFYLSSEKVPHEIIIPTLAEAGIIDGCSFQVTRQTVGAVLVKTLTGKTITIDVTASVTVYDLKLLIEAEEGIPHDQQRLVFGGRQLEDDKTLISYGIYDRTVLHLVLRLRGGCFAQGTLVTLANGTCKEIEKISCEDTVVSYDDHTHCLCTSRVQRLITKHVNQLCILKARDMANGTVHTVKITESHPCWVSNKGWSAISPKPCSNCETLLVGDRVLLTNNTDAVVTGIVYEEYSTVPFTVYTLALDAPEHQRSFFAGGLLVHNMSGGYEFTVCFGTQRVEIQENDKQKTIARLKEDIAKEINRPASSFDLVHKDNVMDDRLTLEQTGLAIDVEIILKVVPRMGLAAGGVIKQKIYEDKIGPHMYNLAKRARVFVHIANADMWKTITGRSMPPTPATPQRYTAFGYPWFKLWDDEAKDVAPSDEIAGIPTISQAIEIQGEDFDNSLQILESEKKVGGTNEPLHIPSSQIVVTDGDW